MVRPIWMCKWGSVFSKFLSGVKWVFGKDQFGVKIGRFWWLICGDRSVDGEEGGSGGGVF